MERSSAVWIMAVVCMVIDHLGAYVLTGEAALYARMIGRVGLPCWGWLVARGLQVTRDREQYLIRLFGLAVLTSPVYWMLTARYGNPVFSLALGALAVIAGMRWERGTWGIAGMGIVAAAPLLGCDWYMAMAVLVGAESGVLFWLGSVVLLVAYSAVTGVWWQMIGVVGLCCIEWGPCVDWRPGRFWKYSVYPGHLSILAAIKWGLGC